MSRLRAGLMAAALLSSGIEAYGQAVQTGTPAVPRAAGAGAITSSTQEIQGEAVRRSKAPAGPLPGLAATETAQPLIFPKGGPTFVLKAVEFTPSALLPKADLAAIARAHVGKRVDLSALQGIANEVNALYAARGYVTASAVLPPQDLTTRILRVRLVEGRIGAVTATNRQTLSPAYIDRAIPLAPGTVVDAPTLAGEVDRFNRTNTAQIQAALQPGAQFGLTDINLSVVEPPRNTLQIFGDNLGVESVGQYEGGLLYQGYGLIGYDDRLTAYGLAAEGNLFGSAAYNLAVTPYGTRAGISYSRSGIRIVSGPYENFDVKGQSQVGALNLSQPLYNDGPYLLLGNLSASIGQSDTKQAGVKVTDDLVRRGTTGVSGSYFGELFSLTLSPSVSFAHADLRVVDDETDYTLFQMAANASVKIDDRTLFVARGAAQISDTALLPGSDLFQIGGSATVRGFPASSLSGDSGFYTNLELYRNLDSLLTGLEAYVFYDHGTTYADFPSHVSLDSAGVGLNYDWNNRLRAELSVGIPFEHDRVPDTGDATFYARLVATVF